MRRVVWTLSARADLDGIRTYIGQFNPVAAQRMARRILMATQSLTGQFPQAGRSLGGDRYEAPIMSPYVVRYRIEGRDVIILRVRHGARQAED